MEASGPAVYESLKAMIQVMQTSHGAARIVVPELKSGSVHTLKSVSLDQSGLVWLVCQVIGHRDLMFFHYTPGTFRFLSDGSSPTQVAFFDHRSGPGVMAL